MIPEHERSASVSPSKPLDGEIVGLEGERIRVRLETGAIGFFKGSGEGTSTSSYQLGQQGRFQIVRCEENEETLLSLVALHSTEASPAFEHDVDQLQNALAHHRSPPITRDEVIPTLDEQRIQQWLNRVEQNLTNLRRNRAKRLDEEFYSGS
jgi:hypothetical protein